MILKEATIQYDKKIIKPTYKLWLESEEHKIFIRRLWLESKSYKKFWASYFYMIIHPKKCLRLINFSIKILEIYIKENK